MRYHPGIQISRISVEGGGGLIFAVGMVLIVAEFYAASIVRTLKKDLDLGAWIIGEVEPGNGQVIIDGLS